MFDCSISRVRGIADGPPVIMTDKAWKHVKETGAPSSPVTWTPGKQAVLSRLRSQSELPSFHSLSLDVCTLLPFSALPQRVPALCVLVVMVPSALLLSLESLVFDNSNLLSARYGGWRFVKSQGALCNQKAGGFCVFVACSSLFYAPSPSSCEPEAHQGPVHCGVLARLSVVQL